MLCSIRRANLRCLVPSWVQLHLLRVNVSTNCREQGGRGVRRDHPEVPFGSRLRHPAGQSKHCMPTSFERTRRGVEQLFSDLHPSLHPIPHPLSHPLSHPILAHAQVIAPVGRYGGGFVPSGCAGHTSPALSPATRALQGECFQWSRTGKRRTHYMVCSSRDLTTRWQTMAARTLVARWVAIPGPAYRPSSLGVMDLALRRTGKTPSGGSVRRSLGRVGPAAPTDPSAVSNATLRRDHDRP